MEKIIKLIKQFIWILQYVYWNGKKIPLDAFDGRRIQIDMDSIKSVGIEIINDIMQISLSININTNPVYLPLTPGNFYWLSGFLIFWTKGHITQINTEIGTI